MKYFGSSKMKQKTTSKFGVGTSDSNPGTRASDVRFDEDTLSVDLADGRTITILLVWYPRLLNATPKQRKNWQFCAAGFGIHWPDVDEDFSTEGLLEGAPSPEYKRRIQKKSRPTKRLSAPSARLIAKRVVRRR